MSDPDYDPRPDNRVMDRMLDAGLNLQRLEQHLTAGRVELDGEVVTDPYRPAPRSSRLTLDMP